MKFFLSLCYLLFSEMSFSQSICERAQLEIASEELRNVNDTVLHDYFYSLYQNHQNQQQYDFVGSYEVCKNKEDYVLKAKIECVYLEDPIKKIQLMKFKSVEKKFINGIETCREVEYKKKSVRNLYEDTTYNPMQFYKDFALQSCIVLHTPKLFYNKKSFGKEVKNCEKITDDLFDIVSPKCTSLNNKDIADSNPCTALYGHISEQIVKRPEMDKVFNNLSNVFYEKSAEEIGKHFIKHLLQIGEGNIRDALLALSTFSSRVTIPLIKEELYATKQYRRLNSIAYLFDYDMAYFSKNLLSIYYGDQHIRVGQEWVKLSRKYHLFAAFYIGCELKKRGHSDPMVKFATASIGYIYEGKDFFGHYFLEGKEWELSSRNFAVDTEKYLLGGDFAIKYCQ